MQDLAEYYFDLLITETEQILGNKELNNRAKFATITRMANTLSHYFQVQSLDAVNFKDIDLKEWDIENFTKAFPLHSIQQSFRQEA